MPVKLTIDSHYRVGYLELSDADVERTIEESAAILVDLDENDVVVGIEVLDLDAKLDWRNLLRKYHVHSDLWETVLSIVPSIQQYVAASFAGGVRTSPRVKTDLGLATA